MIAIEIWASEMFVAVRKDRWFSSSGPKRPRVDRHIVTRRSRAGCPCDRRRRVQHRRIDRADLQLDRARVADPRPRNFLPAEFACAHIDGKRIRGGPAPAIQQPCPGLEVIACSLEAANICLATQRMPLPQGAGFRPVTVVDADKSLGPGKLRRRAPSTGRRALPQRIAPASPALIARRRAQVDDDNLVAGARSSWRSLGCECAHFSARVPDLYGEAMRFTACPAKPRKPTASNNHDRPTMHLPQIATPSAVVHLAAEQPNPGDLMIRLVLRSSRHFCSWTPAWRDAGALGGTRRHRTGRKRRLRPRLLRRNPSGSRHAGDAPAATPAPAAAEPAPAAQPPASPPAAQACGSARRCRTATPSARSGARARPSST